MKWVINYRDPDRERKEQIKKKSNAILRRLDQNNDKKGGGRLDKLVLSSYEKTILTEVVAPEDIHISFQDIGGLENIIEELRESVIYPLTTYVFLSRLIVRWAIACLVGLC
jgi:ATP-dependent 26S proteasome regulatory subunit